MKNKIENNKTFVLYHKQYCPYCTATRNAIGQMGLDIEMREITENPKYYEELVNGGGKQQVPSLRITDVNKKTQWMYESQDIVKYLYENQHLLKAA